MTLRKAAEKILKEIMGLKNDESLLIVIDKNKRKIAEVFLEEGKKITDKAKLIETSIGKTHGEEPLENVAKEMLNYDVELLITSKSLTHTKATKEAAEKGARIVTMPNVTKGILIRFSNADIEKMYNLGEKLKDLVKNTDNIKVLTDKGTDISFSIKKDRFLYNLGSFLNKKGAVGNIPLGEVCCRIPDENANGNLVIDISVLDEIVDKPIEIVIKDNYAVSIKGGKTAEKLKNTLDKFGKKAYFVAEFGIGTNDTAKITGNILEDEKVLGTCHIALGNDTSSLGGKNDVPIHLDCIIDKPTIFFDNKKIMEKGKFLIN